MHRRHRAGPSRSARVAIGALSIGLLVLGGSASGRGLANPPSDRGVVPHIRDPFPATAVAECAALLGRPSGALKVPGEAAGFPPGGPVGDGILSVAIAGWDPSAHAFDWAANQAVLAVFVKGRASGGDAYLYRSFADRPPALGADHDGGLHAALNPSGTPAAVSHVTFCYNRADAVPDLVLRERSDAGAPLSRGHRIGYAIEVTNVGDADAHHVRIHDEIPMGLHVRGLPVIDGGTCTVTSSVASDGRESWTVDCRVDRLAAGASLSLDIEAEIQRQAHCGDITNAAEVSATDEPARLDDRGNYDEVTDSIVCLPSLALTQTGPDAAHVGDRVRYTFAVMNDGETTIGGIDLRAERCDDAPRFLDRGDRHPQLSPGESWTLICSHRIGPGGSDPIHDAAMVTGTAPDGRGVSAVAGHVVDVVHPRLRLRVDVSPTGGEPGDVVTYAYAASNTGDTPLFDIRIRDDVVGSIGTIARLAPGRSVTLRADVTLPATDVPIRNSGSARGRDALGLVLTADDGASVTVVEASQPGRHGGGTPFTGADAWTPAAAALALAAMGGAALVFARRRPVLGR